MSSRKKEEKKVPGMEQLLQRMKELEELVLKHVKGGTEMEPPTSVDMTAYMPLREKSPLLMALYPGKEDGSRVYTPGESDLSAATAGYWPSGRQWLGLYLGGGDGIGMTRRTNVIPMCLGNGLPFYSPLGLGPGDTAQRIDAMNSCSSAVIDMTGDLFTVGGWTGAFELLYFFAQGFMHVNVVGFPASIPGHCLKYDEGDRTLNVCGMHLAVTARKRRQDVLELLRALMDAMDGWTEFQGNGLDLAVVNFRANFVKPHLEGVRMTVLDRLAVVRNLPRMESDIGYALSVIVTMLVLAEMRTKEFMEASMGNEWAWTRAEFANLQLRAEKASQVVGEGELDERTLPLQQFIELIAMTDAAIGGSRHLI